MAILQIGESESNDGAESLLSLKKLLTSVLKLGMKFRWEKDCLTHVGQILGGFNLYAIQFDNDLEMILKDLSFAQKSAEVLNKIFDTEEDFENFGYLSLAYGKRSYIFSEYFVKTCEITKKLKKTESFLKCYQYSIYKIYDP